MQRSTHSLQEQWWEKESILLDYSCITSSSRAANGGALTLGAAGRQNKQQSEAQATLVIYIFLTALE